MGNPLVTKSFRYLKCRFWTWFSAILGVEKLPYISRIHPYSLYVVRIPPFSFRYLKCLVKCFISPDHKAGYFWGVYVTSGGQVEVIREVRLPLPRVPRSCWQDTYWPWYSERNLRKGPTVDGSEIRLTSWYWEYPVFHRISYITGGARFLPSTLPFHETGFIVSPKQCIIEGEVGFWPHTF